MVYRTWYIHDKHQNVSVCKFYCKIFVNSATTGQCYVCVLKYVKMLDFFENFTSFRDEINAVYINYLRCHSLSWKKDDVGSFIALS